MIGVRFKFDYDPSRWVMIPPAGAADYDQWAAQTAKAWARDLDREADSNWESVFERMLLRCVVTPNSARWDARFINVIAQPGKAASLLPANLMMMTPEEAGGSLAANLPRPEDPELVEPPVVETFELHPDMSATRIIRYVRDGDDDHVRADMFVVWRGHPQAELGLVTGSDEVGRLLLARDDLVELARAITLVPLDEPAV